MVRHLLSILILILSGIAMASEDPPLEAFVTSEKAFIWQQPGYSWTDCRPLGPSNAPWNKYKSAEDKALTMKRFESGAKEACNARDQKNDLLKSGDPVEVLRKKDGSIFSEEHELLVNGQLMKKRFYMVVSAHGRMGWMSAAQISEPGPKEELPPRASLSKPKDKKFCPPRSKTADSAKTFSLQIPKLQEAVDRDLMLGTPKSNREIDHFACLYHSAKIKDDSFPQMYKKFQKSVAQASKAMGVPYGLIMCTMLDESELYYNPKEEKEYKGLGQFGSDLVSDLDDVRDREPYKQMWSNYQKMSHATFSDEAIRSSSNPAPTAGAIALAYQWMFRERLNKAGCKECSMGPNISRKELYMLVTGYDSGPYSLSKIANKTAAEMRNSYPPRSESRDYMASVENCLEKGNNKSFRADRDGGAQNKLQQRRLASEQSSYQERVNQCDRLYPVK